MQDFDALLRLRTAVDPLELRRLVSTLQTRVLGKQKSTSVGRYVLRRKLGQGGFGTVYQAFDPDIRREVALKVLRTDRYRPHRTLKDEARALAAVESPHIVDVLDYGNDDGRDFLVMTLVDGVSLRDWDIPDLDQLLLVLGDILRAVEAIHARGLVHCDLKPDNIFVDARGRAVVIDFGLALPSQELTSRNRPIGGSPPYSAPEQFGRNAIDARVDQYALGRIGLELLELLPASRAADRCRQVLRRARSIPADARYNTVTELRRALFEPAPLASAALAVLVSVVIVGYLAGFRAAPAPPPENDTRARQGGRVGDPLRRRIERVSALMDSGDLDAARKVLDAIPKRVWRDADASSRADGLATRASLMFHDNDVQKGLEHLESAVWTALESERHETVALHATELAARIAQHLGDADAAERMSALAWISVEQLGSPPRLVARHWNAKAHMERFLGRTQQALRAAKNAVAAFDDTPDEPSWEELSGLGVAYLAVGDLHNARDNLQLGLKKAGEDTQAYLNTAPALAAVEYQLGRVEHAIALARDVVAKSTALLGETDPYTLTSRGQLGQLLIEDDPAAAVAELRAVDEAYGGTPSPHAVAVRANLGLALARAGDPDGGERILLRALADIDSQGTAPPFDVATLWGMLGEVRVGRGDFDAAARAYEHGLDQLPADAEFDPLRAELGAQLEYATSTAQAPRVSRHRVEDGSHGRHDPVSSGGTRSVGAEDSPTRPPNDL